jgi:hypothetical protein
MGVYLPLPSFLGLSRQGHVIVLDSYFPLTKFFINSQKRFDSLHIVN